jgi:hypothetical protein
VILRLIKWRFHEKAVNDLLSDCDHFMRNRRTASIRRFAPLACDDERAMTMA